MTPRSIRRASERKARKQLSKTSRAGQVDSNIAQPAASKLVETNQSCHYHDSEEGKRPTIVEQTYEFMRLRNAGFIPRSSSPFMVAFNEWRSQGCPTTSFPIEHVEEPAPAPISPSRLAANRANAQLSTGPTSPQGKANIAHNALKTGLTGRTVLLPADDAAAYESHIRRFFIQYRPEGDREAELVQSLADTRWRLNRIPSLEAGIYALAKIQFADLFLDQDTAVRAALIEAHTFLTFQKQLNNLSVQEARLRRHFEKDLAELQQSQSDRRKHEPPPTAAEASAQTAQPASALSNGFEFSTGDFVAETIQHRNPCEEGIGRIATPAEF